VGPWDSYYPTSNKDNYYLNVNFKGLINIMHQLDVISVVLSRFGSHPADSGPVKRTVKLKNTSPCGE